MGFEQCLRNHYLNKKDCWAIGSYIGFAKNWKRKTVIPRKGDKRGKKR
jgi:hypothetical protein